MLARNPKPDMNRLAGVLDERLEAVLLDAVLVGVSLLAVGYVVGAVVGGGHAVAIVFAQFASLLAFPLYYIGFEGRSGQTPGKALRGIVVVGTDGSPCSWSGAIIRNLLRYVDVLPVLYLVGLAVAYVSEDNQRLGDIGGGTVVVHTDG